MKLTVSDNQGILGTLELDGDSYVAVPPTLADLIETRVARGLSVDAAFADLNGWSNGYVTVTEG